MNWDDIRLFLAVVRKKSIRAAAATLGVNHATVSRRIRGLEKDLGVRLFEKLPTGYVITPASEEILAFAERMEEQVNALERKVYGRDSGLTGKLRVTLPQIMVTDLLMPSLVNFTESHPRIELEIITAYETLNMTKRQADVAIRLVYEGVTPPEHLYGRKLVSLNYAAYISRQDKKDWEQLSWIRKEDDSKLPAAAKKAFAVSKKAPYIVNDLLVQIAATRAGMGASLLPCFCGDHDPQLRRLPPGNSYHYGNIWILTHGDLRNTPRVRAFNEFMVSAIKERRDMIEGNISL